MDALRKRQATILLVEDRSLSRQNVARFFDISGYEVYQAENGENAIALLSCTKFDVVISDLNLPGQIT
jgi:DNA-binding response OmpR family regulator